MEMYIPTVELPFLARMRRRFLGDKWVTTWGALKGPKAVKSKLRTFAEEQTERLHDLALKAFAQDRWYLAGAYMAAASAIYACGSSADAALEGKV